MRNLAQQLGYEVMSLYNHVANKDELMSLMVDAVAGEIDEPPPTGPNRSPPCGHRGLDSTTSWPDTRGPPPSG